MIRPTRRSVLAASLWVVLAVSDRSGFAADEPPASARPAPPAPPASKSTTPASSRADPTSLVFCDVPGTSVVVSCLPAGRHVKKGDVLAELDSARFRERLANQLREVRRAEAELANARLTREAAELALKEDEAEGNREREALRGEVVLAEKERDLAQTVLRDRQRAAKAVGGDAGKSAAEARVQRMQLKIERLRGALNVLEKHTLPRRSKEAAAELSMATTRETAKRQAKAQADESAAGMRRQIDRCRVLATRSGLLLHVRPRGPEDEPRVGNFEAGSRVREGQPMFRIVPDDAVVPTR